MDSETRVGDFIPGESNLAGPWLTDTKTDNDLSGGAGKQKHGSERPVRMKSCVTYPLFESEWSITSLHLTSNPVLRKTTLRKLTEDLPVDTILT